MNILNIAINDIKKMSKLKVQLALVLFMPLLMIFLMGNALKPFFNADNGIEKFQVLYVNEDKGSLGAAFDSFMKNDASKFVEVVDGNTDTAESEVLSGKYNAAVIVPSDLSEMVSKGEKADIRVISLGNDAVRDLMINSIVDSFVMFAKVQSGIMNSYLEAQQKPVLNPIEYDMDFVVARSADISATKAISSFQYFTLSMLLFFMLAVGVGVGGGIVEDRVNGIYSRINSYPIKDSEYLIGKILSNLILTLLQIIIVVLFSAFVFKVDWGTNFLGIGIAMILMMLISSSIGLVFSSLVNSLKAIDSVVIIVIWMITFLSGGFVPIPALEPIARFTFYKWGLDSLTNFMIGGSILEVSNNLLLLLTTVIILWTLGLYLYKRRISHE